MTRFSAAALAALILGTSAALAGGHGTVRIGTEGAYAPYNYLDDNGEVAGFERVLGDELCKRAELTCEWVTNDWDSIIPNLVSGNYDAIMAGMSITSERDKVIDFSDAYTQPDPSSYASMEGMDAGNLGVVAAQTGTIQASFIASTGAQLLEFATPEETVAAVRNGEADAVLADRAYLEPIVTEGGSVVFIGEPVFLGGGVGIGLRESDAALREKLNAAIQSMKADGSLNALIKEWLPDAGTF